tara:strand:- start:1413 stop:1682 length:270 start_codon:yes stop_codon:yes gene_type:complete
MFEKSMQIIKSGFLVLISFFILGIFFYWFLAFDSAFEADQSCHYYLNKSSDTLNSGCDHDLETHQWILYKNQSEFEPAKVVKRFRYKFL